MIYVGYVGYVCLSRSEVPPATASRLTFEHLNLRLIFACWLAFVAGQIGHSLLVV
jgi:hypothetical protein